MSHSTASTIRACPRLAGWTVVGTWWLLMLPVSLAEETGKQIYLRQCAQCHGASGEGTEEHYAEPLIGDRSRLELAHLIAETMPEDNPEACTGPNAEKVAAYIHEAFYSDLAQARNAPARIELARLTVRQYENAVADLLRESAASITPVNETGLRGEYFYSHRFRKPDREFERVDSTIDFDFGEERPVAEAQESSPREMQEPADNADDQDKETDTDFSIRWSGSVVAPVTGEYEFILETQNGAKLWINDVDTPLIDVWVQSENRDAYRGTVRLLAGRRYPLRLECFKHKEKKSAIRLLWKPPAQVTELIPSRVLDPEPSKPTFVITTPFPPDDRSLGYERGNAVSREWEEATTFAAVEVASWLAERIPEIAPQDLPREQRRTKLEAYCHELARRAFRRPLPAERREFFVDQRFEDMKALDEAFKRAVILTLKSPRFLYREGAMSEFDQYSAASWLSFGLWDSLPDEKLRNAAEKGRLATHEEVSAQARRMAEDPRAQAKLRAFFHQWLQLERFHDLAKDELLFAGFDEQLASDLRTSLDLRITDFITDEKADFRQLMLANTIYLNHRLAKFYGEQPPAAEGDFHATEFEPEHRAGIISHPYLLAGFAYRDASSPIHRGVFVARGLLGRRLKPPPEAVTPFAPDLHPGLTTRERVSLQTQPAACQTCHGMINGLGFPFEFFDAVGRYREQERGQPINGSGTYFTRTEQEAVFANLRDLAEFLAVSEEAQEAFIEQLFQYIIKQPVRAFGDGELQRLRSYFEEHEFRLRDLLVEIIASSALKAGQLRNSSSQVARHGLGAGTASRIPE